MIIIIVSNLFTPNNIPNKDALKNNLLIKKVLNDLNLISKYALN